MSEVREAVRSRYANAAKLMADFNALGSALRAVPWRMDQIAAAAAPTRPTSMRDIDLRESVRLGCGNPTLLARLEPGQIVLDLGSGAGLDVLLSARRVSPGGHACGVDITDEMLQLANGNMEKAGVMNASFLKGIIEDVPLPDSSVDVVISNCVINLAEDKGAVIRQASRVLRPGGRFAVADMVEL